MTAPTEEFASCTCQRCSAAGVSPSRRLRGPMFDIRWVRRFNERAFEQPTGFALGGYRLAAEMCWISRRKINAVKYLSRSSIRFVANLNSRIRDGKR